ncbi:hypothetical protein MKEN_01220700 [Mycena kentingensis (nom. inval.)]|nr:hypothetical protein MKEN_01220700 [Mycena kentingensis (nom. inval.)]
MLRALQRKFLLVRVNALSSLLACRLASGSSAPFHTSAIRSAVIDQRIRSRQIKKANVEARERRILEREANKPSVILGTRPGQESKWDNCLLARTIVDDAVFDKEKYNPASMVESDTSFKTLVPRYRGFGVAKAEEKILFDDLRTLTQQVVKKRTREDITAANFARVIDLRNADAGGIAYENRRRIITAFSTPENPFDPGRTEVQVAIVTYRIRKLYAHLKRCKPDVQNKLSLRKLVHKRAKLLKYLKRTQRVRYDILLEQLALEPEAVEGELVVN